MDTYLYISFLFVLELVVLELLWGIDIIDEAVVADNMKKTNDLQKQKHVYLLTNFKGKLHEYMTPIAIKDVYIEIPQNV